MKREMIENRLDALIEEGNVPHAHLFKAARYSLLLPGKRLRPLLLLTLLETYGIPIEKGLDPACAIEMIHTYSLIHDDLPCMDDDDLRRGKPTLHKVYNEGHAVLTGDYLLTYAFEVLANSSGLTAEQKIECVKILASRSGGDGMIGGQVIDIAHADQSIEWDVLEEMHLRKTAALISASLEMGGIIAGVNAKDTELLKTCGNRIGLAFQIIDDILDVTGNEVQLGKPVGSDEANHKTTSVTLLTLPKAKQMADTLLTSAKETLASLTHSSSSLESLITQCIQRKY